MEAEDEIGELIQTYNQMVDQLDESAHMLAKSERDNAREKWQNKWLTK